MFFITDYNVNFCTGNYFLKLADGRERHVTYTADESGFHPEIQTNELGTESKNPGDAVYVSSAPSGPDAAIQAYGGPFPESIGQGLRPVQARAAGAASAAAAAASWTVNGHVPIVHSTQLALMGNTSV